MTNITTYNQNIDLCERSRTVCNHDHEMDIFETNKIIVKYNAI